MDNLLSEPSLPVFVVVGSFGLILGSFFNVVIYRLPLEGMSIVRPRSACPGCHKMIAWYDNIPVLSWIFLFGRCRHCSKSISIRYPLVEILTAVMLLATLHLSRGEGDAVVLIRMVIVSALLVVTFIDFDHFIIPDSISVTGMVVSPVLSYLVPNLHRQSFLAEQAAVTPEIALVSSLMGVAAGAGSVYLVGVLGKLVFKKEAMGFGDVKLMGAMGGFLGAGAILAAFFLGAMFGAIFGFVNVFWIGIRRCLRLKKRGWPSGRSWAAGLQMGRRRGSYIPFGPFLSLGCLGLLFFRQEVFTLALETWPQWVRSWL